MEVHRVGEGHIKVLWFISVERYLTYSFTNLD